MNVLAPPTTAGFETPPIEVGYGVDGKFEHKLPITLYGMGTFASDVIILEYYDGFQWATYKRGTATVQLSPNDMVLVIDHPLRFRLKKKASTNQLGVAISAIPGQQYMTPGYEGVFLMEDGTNHMIAEDDKNIQQNNTR